MGVIGVVPWWSIPLALFAGVVIGIILIALVSANEKDGGGDGCDRRSETGPGGSEIPGKILQ